MNQTTEWLKVESIELEAQGVAHNAEGKVVFIDCALPGEIVKAQISRRKNNWEQGQLTEIKKESPLRVTPGCPHFGLHAGACGGCKMQHLQAGAQVAVKQRVVEDNLWHLGKVKPEVLLRPIEGPTWGYRYRARFSVRYVAKKGEVLIGFHERKSRYVADMQVCKVVPKVVSDLLMPLRALIASMAERDRLPQIELAMGDEVIALVLRHLNPMPAGDIALLRACGTPRCAVVAAAQGAGHRQAPGRRRRAARLPPARVRRDDALQADRLHPGQPAHQRGPRGARAAAAGGRAG